MAAIVRGFREKYDVRLLILWRCTLPERQMYQGIIYDTHDTSHALERRSCEGESKATATEPSADHDDIPALGRAA